MGLDLLADAVAQRLTRFTRKARIRVQASAGAVRSRLYAAKAVRDEHSAEDGSIEIGVELPDVELLALARTAGVQAPRCRGTRRLKVAPSRRRLSKAPRAAFDHRKEAPKVALLERRRLSKAPQAAFDHERFALCLRDGVPTIDGRFGAEARLIISISYGVESTRSEQSVGPPARPVRATVRISMSA